MTLKVGHIENDLIGGAVLSSLGLVDVNQRADFGGGEGNVLVADHDFQLLQKHKAKRPVFKRPKEAIGIWSKCLKKAAHLSSNSIGRRPQRVVLFGDLAVVDDPLELLHDALVHVRLAGGRTNNNSHVTLRSPITKVASASKTRRH